MKTYLNWFWHFPFYENVAIATEMIASHVSIYSEQILMPGHISKHFKPYMYTVKLKTGDLIVKQLNLK